MMSNRNSVFCSVSDFGRYEQEDRANPAHGVVNIRSFFREKSLVSVFVRFALFYDSDLQ